MPTASNKLHLGPGVSVTITPGSSDGDTAVVSELVTGIGTPNLLAYLSQANSRASLSRALPPLESVQVTGMERGMALQVARYGFGRNGSVQYKPQWRWRTTRRTFESYYAEDDDTPLPPGITRLAVHNLVTYDYMIWDKETMVDALDGWAGLGNWVGSTNSSTFGVADGNYAAGLVRFDGFFGEQRVIDAFLNISFGLRFTVDATAPHFWGTNRLDDTGNPDWFFPPQVSFPALPT
jgi:hypothetical protein